MKRNKRRLSLPSLATGQEAAAKKPYRQSALPMSTNTNAARVQPGSEANDAFNRFTHHAPLTTPPVLTAAVAAGVFDDVRGGSSCVSSDGEAARPTPSPPAALGINADDDAWCEDLPPPLEAAVAVAVAAEPPG